MKLRELSVAPVVAVMIKNPSSCLISLSSSHCTAFLISLFQYPSPLSKHP